MTDIVKAIADTDEAAEFHLSRILILLDAFSSESEKGYVEGLTKLAKLDFLLRYPVMLERALIAKRQSTNSVKVAEYERYSVESEMVRYRFGPWDHRYREFLNLLVGKGLINISIEGRKIVITITDRGRAVVTSLKEVEAFEPYERRAKILRTHFNFTASHLMNFIYETFPEIISLRSNTAIPL